MSARLDVWVERFVALMQAHLAGAGEAALEDAYALGRDAIESGLGLLDLASAYHVALGRVLSGASVQESDALFRQAAALFAESLSPYEMTQRGFGEAVAALRHMNATLEQQVLERTEAARAATAQAQEALQLREIFLSVASHELKTPLTALRGNVQLLQRRAARESLLAEREQRLLQSIVEQSIRLDKLVNMLLDISRIKTGQLVIQPAPVDLAALLRRLVDEVRPTLETHSLTLSGVDGPVLIGGDELRLDQVFQNLVHNAIKYSPDGGPIAVHLESRDGQACVYVVDQGIGIPPEAIEQVFGRFYRAANTQERRLGGMGIGLYVVKEVVTLHGGRVEVESREGVGSTFSVYLPLLEATTLSHPQGDEQQLALG